MSREVQCVKTYVGQPLHARGTLKGVSRPRRRVRLVRSSPAHALRLRRAQGLVLQPRLFRLLLLVGGCVARRSMGSKAMYAITKRGDHARTWHRPDCAVVKRVPRHVTTELEPEAYRAEREARLSAKFGYEYHDYANNVRCGSCLDRPAPGPAISKSDLRRIFASAREAGLAAARAAVPEPMVIGTPKNMMASLMGQ